jgi:SAM-dependent methyltransferase/tetratricopeptide (TPR) repeat protein
VNRKQRRTAEGNIRAKGQRIPDGGGSARELVAIGVAHHRAGQLSDAGRYYRRALEVDPTCLDALNSFGQLLMETRNLEGALTVLTRALSIRETERTKAMFVSCLRGMRHVPDVPGLRGVVVRAMSEPWARPAEVAYAAASLIRSGIAGQCIERAAAAWPRRLTERDLFVPPGIAAIAKDQLLRVTLESAPVCDGDLERFLTTFRSALLHAASANGGTGPPDEAVLAVHCALARQCFINEYVFAPAEGELDQARGLRDSVERALASDAPVPVLSLVAIAAYCPLHSLHGAGALLQRLWPEPVQALLTQQVREPFEESKLRTAIPRLTAIKDGVSLQVQQQYEENPYPRWLTVRPRTTTVSIDDYLRGHLPLAPFRALGKTAAIDYLMAGCGTGQTIIEAARLIGGVKILAIDLSMAGLAYAKRKAAEFGVSSVEFAQADILELHSLHRSFDIINCSGVLHHLAEPMAGWKVLISLLRSGGFMRVGVYSEIARRNSMAARAFVARRGFRPTAEEIRRCRQDILDLPDGDPVRIEARNSDFFTLSGCRDWLFHVRERPLTLPEIARFLAENDLDFVGFNVSSAVAARYAARFPHDPSLTDLASWEQFEQENPRSFMSMYQFWIQKRPAPG